MLDFSLDQSQQKTSLKIKKEIGVYTYGKSTDICINEKILVFVYNSISLISLYVVLFQKLTRNISNKKHTNYKT